MEQPGPPHNCQILVALMLMASKGLPKQMHKLEYKKQHQVALEEFGEAQVIQGQIKQLKEEEQHLLSMPIAASHHTLSHAQRDAICRWVEVDTTGLPRVLEELFREH